MVGVCVIGCGAAGLCSARHVLDQGMEVVIFEKTDSLGGTWVYTDKTGLDDYGLPIHTSMYKSLRTNLPKEIMGFPDFPIPEQDKSYLPSADILSFLKSYAETFQLVKHIKFNHLVKRVRPVGDKWNVTVVDLPNKEEKELEFDAVMVCNGHYHTPLVPQLEGLESFPGEVMHSHDYRDPKPFQGKTVIVLGAGPSGIDLCIEIARTADNVILSHHLATKFKKEILPDNVDQRSEITRVMGSEIIFQDGSSISADVIFFCTGYKYSFPFLDKECDITVEDNYVEPLYLHMINIEHPTMCLIGLPYYVCAFSLFDLQARLFLKTLKGEVELPNKENMYCQTRSELKIRSRLGLMRKQGHMMGPLQGMYYEQLASAGQLKPLPPVMTSVHNDASKRQVENLINFRNDKYKIIDEENFLWIQG